jgi:Zinc binding domain/BFD-like [2Fe-2S] binding domain
MSDCCSVNGKPAAAPSVMVCPVNGARSKQVDMLTVRSLVRRLPLGMANAQYYFCEAPQCDVVYFPSSPQAPIFRRADLLVRVGGKETRDPIPVCYCFGFTRKDIEDEVAQTGHSTISDRITAEVKAGNCACEVKNPSGKCCLGNVTRVVQHCARAVQGGQARGRVVVLHKSL